MKEKKNQSINATPLGINKKKFKKNPNEIVAGIVIIINANVIPKMDIWVYARSGHIPKAFVKNHFTLSYVEMCAIYQFADCGVMLSANHSKCFMSLA
ncbi:hypothetical protein BpHYR1_046494 [Brachionus plicatilis]|uniref:Uncharacterized protein n=1 Tax=Brachionus plicatilis TaxID=10195 RepID=A0A3M7PTJ4_BRAPC|nr:hypothetical protein BpHYR1_046494 [Brachionus plicatilis]